MKQEVITFAPFDSSIFEDGAMILTHTHQYNDGSSAFIVGSPGLPNLSRRMNLGEAVIFEIPTLGMYEFRYIGRIEDGNFKMLVTHIAPAHGFHAGFVSDDPDNSSFTPDDVTRIKSSLSEALDSIKISNILNAEQLDLMSRKFDEISNAASRMGRKDWITYSAGALTSLCISAAFAPEVSKNIFSEVAIAFNWLFQGFRPFIS